MNGLVWEHRSNSPEATRALGARMARALHGGLVVALVGPLGAGKTLLVKGLAHENAGRPCEVTSPTFTLIQEYTGRLHLYHLDVYRLSGPADPLLAGLDEMVRADSVAIVEWADRVQSALAGDTLWVTIVPGAENDRVFQFRAVGATAKKCMEGIIAGK